MRKKTTRKKKSWLRPPAQSKRGPSRPSRSKCGLGERGFFGLGALASIAVMIAIALAVGTAIALALPYITETLAEGLNLGPLLIHIPVMEGGTFWTASSSAPEASGIFYMSAVMGELYETMMTISFAVLLIAFVLVGLFYALEQFRVVGEGTASTILSESVFVIILIFIFPLLFNGAAIMINGIDEGIIMHHVDDEGITTYDAMVVDVARYAGTVPGLLEKEIRGIPLIGDIPNMMSKAITVLITSSVSLIAIFTAFATGVFKVLAIAVLAAAFPLILVLRLIPFTRSVSTRLTGAFIGLLLASIVMALFFRVAWGVLEYGGLGDVMVWALGCGTLIAVTAAFTITAPALSGMAAAIGHTIGRGVAAPTAGLIAGGVTTGLAMVPAGGMAAGMAMRTPGVGARGVLGATGRGMGAGALAGGPAKEPFGAFSAGIGVGRSGGTERYLAGRMGLKDDIQKTTNTFIHGKGMGEKMENFEVARADLAKDPTAYRDARESGGEVASNIDKWGDNEAYDAFGRADKGAAYDPKVHRKIYQASDLKPYEIKQGAKLAHSKMAGDPRYGPDGANLAMKFIHDGKVVYPSKAAKLKGNGVLMFPPRGK